jgi:hypothetical protein
MKSLREYITESEHWVDNPVAGDSVGINIREECLVESYIVETLEDGVILYSDQEMMSILEGYDLIEDMNSLDYQDEIENGLIPEDTTEEEPSSDEPPNEPATTDPMDIDEAEYRGRKVPLGKPMRGDVKKFKVYVKDPKTGNIKKVNFGHGGTSAKRLGQTTMRIKKSNPARRRNFRARHNCDNPGPRTKARYWSCRAW